LCISSYKLLTDNPIADGHYKMYKETLIKSCYAIWRPFSRLAALSDTSISPASPAVTRLARRENDSPSDVTAFNQHFHKVLPDREM
jgi:hypothetical protein